MYTFKSKLKYNLFRNGEINDVLLLFPDISVYYNEKIFCLNR